MIVLLVMYLISCLSGTYDPYVIAGSVLVHTGGMFIYLSASLVIPDHVKITRYSLFESQKGDK